MEAHALHGSATAEAYDPTVLLRVLGDVKAGDFTARMPVHRTGLDGKIADGLNEIISANQAFATELQRVSRIVGKEGKLSQRASFKGTDQVWGDSIESVNSLIEDLVRPSNEMQRVIGAVADGDLSKKVSVVVQGEMLELKNTINGMVDQLNRFISEVTRVAREVGTEGKLGQAAAYTIEVGGVWKELTDNVNLMAGNLTGQVRNIAEVTTAVANGDLSKKITADVRGEFLELKNTVNGVAFYGGAAAGTKVLIVDDDFRNIFALTALLDRGKITVVSAESGDEALTLLDEDGDVDIVLLDIMMPVMNGYETMAAIRSRPGCERLPIIAVTAKVNPGERDRCMAAGASAYIPKPVATAELLAALDPWFPASRALAALVHEPDVAL